MSEQTNHHSNGNGEKRWLRWVAKVILPALIAAQWVTLSADFDDLRLELRELRRAVGERLLHDSGQDAALERLDLLSELLLNDYSTSN
jgi:hypothetical protein